MFLVRCLQSKAARTQGHRTDRHTVSLSLDSVSLSLRVLDRCIRVGRGDEQTAPLSPLSYGNSAHRDGKPPPTPVLRSLAFSLELGGAITPFSGIHV